jgi:lipoate---protein ligase
MLLSSAEALGALPWTVERIVADPVDTFAADPFEGFGQAADGSRAAGSPDSQVSRLIRVRTVTRPAIVLGSAQRDELIDREAAEANGIAVVRRRSGGGAVWLDASSISWIDVMIGAGDPLWKSDVGKAFWWLGELWANSLRAYDRSLNAAAYKGALVTNEWSKLICYSGLGPGEVTIDDAKVVGISQKRTREAVLFQCGVLHGWDPSMLLHYCVLNDNDRARAYDELEDFCTTVSPEAVDTFLAALT